ncbi:type IV conjugative transfer system lipoprotein TraV [Rouxiella badensis]|uniref:type IV conjugative transfer system lipoprotein TraV n=1 Tax=Rouxiella badensis TaxID=1646377 RepID=UPI00178853FF|nr:type IV conjugative transfer system lipoprotein TraV [Rouxiella badensis]QOI58095.1 type IV conjugative transfer system lipoprotein TraV [Rouxiella badensis subsp. acadiensis]
MKKTSFTLILCSLLTGCAGMNSDFDCNKTAIDKCLTMGQAQGLAATGKSIDDVDTSADTAKKPVTSTVTSPPPFLHNTPVPVKPYVAVGYSPAISKGFLASTSTAGISTSPVSQYIKVSNPNSPGSVSANRTGDIVQRLWVSPWVDKDDNFHQPSVVEFVKNKSHWDQSYNSITSEN